MVRGRDDLKNFPQVSDLVGYEPGGMAWIADGCPRRGLTF
jgi:hypothetical protein